MFKLYFKYGVMGCSKSAQALMTSYNYEQKKFNVLLIKPGLDIRDNENEKSYVKSRIGLKQECITFKTTENLLDVFNHENDRKKVDVVIMDECQFATKSQIEQCREITKKVPVICYGLKNNFKSELFEGSKRLIELAESLQEIKSVCSCGSKATQNARVINGNVIISGAEILIGADETYQAMCFECFEKKLLLVK